MRLRILPGSLWIAYTITSPATVQSRLPASLVLAPTALLEDEASAFPTPKLLFNVYRVDAGLAMQGTRVEVVTFARHRTRNTPHLVVLDCLTDTLQWDPVHGVRGANAHVDGNAARYAWDVRTSTERLSVRASPARRRRIDRTFVVDANRACYYGRVDVPYAMYFDAAEVARPVRDLYAAHLENTLWRDVRSARASHLFCHEHAMTFDVNVTSFA